MTLIETPDGLVLHHAECLDVLRALPDESVHAVVTDPPYGLANTDPAHVAETITRWVSGDREYLPGGSGFMGKAWDAFVPPVAVWDECLRVLKPGGHLLAFAGSRTFDLMALGIRLAGFDVRDSVAWLYGSGFPKSLDVSKAIDKRGGRPDLAGDIAAAIKAARESRGWTTGQADRHFCGGSTNWTWYEGRKGICRPPTPADFARIAEEWPELAPWVEKVAEAERQVVGQRTTGRGAGRGSVAIIGDSENRDVTAPATPEAEAWQGWGTALKPAFEPIVVARKPLVGTVAANVLAHGTGAINVDACRIGDEVRHNPSAATNGSSAPVLTVGRETVGRETVGRWPANVALDESQAAELDRQTGVLTSGKMRPTHTTAGRAVYGANATGGFTTMETYGASGGASRFFYVAKAPKSERPNVDGVAHPTVKPLALMRWLVRLVTPPGGVVLEPFAGSGTTVEAALLEGFDVVAVEREADYLPLILARIERVTDPEGLL